APGLAGVRLGRHRLLAGLGPAGAVRGARDHRVARCPRDLRPADRAQLPRPEQHERPLLHAAGVPAHRRAVIPAGVLVAARHPHQPPAHSAAARAGARDRRRAAGAGADQAGAEPGTGRPRYGARRRAARCVLSRALPAVRALGLRRRVGARRRRDARPRAAALAGAAPAPGPAAARLARARLSPARSQGPADLDPVPAAVRLDAFYLALSPLFERWGYGAAWALAAGATLGLVLLPWLVPRRRPPVAVVDPANCNGCRFCFDHSPS